MPLHDLSEDGVHGVVIKLVNGDQVEVAHESWRDWVTTTTCIAHVEK